MADCIHHYILPPTGRVVTGVCKLCGISKTWDNTLIDGADYWHETRKTTWKIKLDKLKEAVL